MKITLKSVGHFLVDLIELYIPAAAFATLFISFMTQIVSRYFFKPLTWPEELSLLCFCWVALLGGLYAKRSESHVAFAMVYDMLKPRGKARMRLVGNTLLMIAFLEPDAWLVGAALIVAALLLRLTRNTLAAR